MIAIYMQLATGFLCALQNAWSNYQALHSETQWMMNELRSLESKNQAKYFQEISNVL